MSAATAVWRDRDGREDAFVRAIGAGPTHAAAFEAFQAMLIAENSRMNLVGESTLAHFWTRHVVDCAQLLWFAREARVWADLGSGAGLPGIILAILLKEVPGARVHLIESVAKRSRFLSRVVQALDLPAVVHNARAERLGLAGEVVTARACAPLSRLLTYAAPYIQRGALGLFLKGRSAEAEVADAQKSWRFDAEVHASLSDPAGRVLAIRMLSHA